MDHAEHQQAGQPPAAPTNNPNAVELVATTADDRPILEHLALSCAYVYSALMPRDVEETGTFRGGGRGLRRGC